MTAGTKRVRQSEKLDLRLTAAAKRSLQAAAERQHKSLTEFVLDSALTTAEAILMEQRSIELSAEWKAILARNLAEHSTPPPSPRPARESAPSPA
jgi:uncharacterized protein (DUF1778 family)